MREREASSGKVLHNPGDLAGMEPAVASVTSGVPQGSVIIGPLLLIFFINDLPDSVVSPWRLYADDAIIYNSRDHQGQLQSDLDVLNS